MIDTDKIKKDIKKLNEAMLKMGFDWDFIDDFWKKTINDVKINK